MREDKWHHVLRHVLRFMAKSKKIILILRAENSAEKSIIYPSYQYSHLFLEINVDEVCLSRQVEDNERKNRQRKKMITGFKRMNESKMKSRHT